MEEPDNPGGGDEPDPVVPSSFVTPISINVSSDTTSAFVDVNSDNEWTATCPDGHEWISFTKTDCGVSIGMSKNDGANAEDRTCTFIIAETIEGGQSEEVTITQHTPGEEIVGDDAGVNKSTDTFVLYTDVDSLSVDAQPVTLASSEELGVNGSSGDIQIIY